MLFRYKGNAIDVRVRLNKSQEIISLHDSLESKRGFSATTAEVLVRLLIVPSNLAVVAAALGSRSDDNKSSLVCLRKHNQRRWPPYAMCTLR